MYVSTLKRQPVPKVAGFNKGQRLFLLMFTREEAALIRQSFWTSFGKYMAPVPSASGERINWINYKTGIRHIHLRMNAEKNLSYIGIEITHPDVVVQQLYFEQLSQFDSLLENAADWQWNRNDVKENGKPFCSISKTNTAYNIFKKEDWPGIISFLKPALIELDAFWWMAKDLLEIL